MNIKLKDNPLLTLSDYIYLDYIEFTGEQGIPLNVTLTGFRVVTELMLSSGNRETNIVGDRVGSSTNVCIFGTHHDGALMLYFTGNGTSSSSKVNVGNDLWLSVDATLSQNKLVLYVNGNKLIDTTTITSGTASLFMGKGNYAGGKFKIKNTKIYTTSDELVLDLYPAMRKSNNAIGMFDAANCNFFENNRSTPLIAGPSISSPIISSSINSTVTTFYHNNCPNIDGYGTLKYLINIQRNNQSEIKYNYYKNSQLWNNIKTTYPDLIPYTNACHAMLGNICTCITPGPMQLASDCNDFINNEITRLEYIESTGTQYIDTEISFPSGFRSVAKLYPTSVSSHKDYAGSFQTNLHNIHRIKNGTWNPCSGNNAEGVYGSVNVNTLYTVDMSNANAKYNLIVNGSILANNVSTSTGYSSLTCWLFAVHRTDSTDYQYYSGRIYEISLYDENNILKFYGLPCITDLGTPGMYDIVSQRFFYNKGTGNFVAGPEISSIGDNITDYVPNCTYDETPIILLNRVRVDIGNVSGSIDELLQYSTLAGFNDNYEPQEKPRLVGTWTITGWYSYNDYLTALSTFDGLTIDTANNFSYHIIDQNTIHIISSVVPPSLPPIDLSTYTTIFVGQGSSLADDQALKALFSSNGTWSSYSSKFAEYYYYTHEGAQYEYIEISSAQYINTLISAPQGYKVDAVIQPTSTADACFFGAIEQAEPYLRNWLGISNGEWRFTSSKKLITGPTPTLNTIHIIADNRTPETPMLVIDNVLYQTVADTFSDTSMSAKPLYLGRMNSSDASLPCKIYSCKIYDYTDTLVRDFVPVLDYRGIVCFKDLVSNTFFYNQGTGSFTPGPEV